MSINKKSVGLFALCFMGYLFLSDGDEPPLDSKSVSIEKPASIEDFVNLDVRGDPINCPDLMSHSEMNGFMETENVFSIENKGLYSFKQCRSEIDKYKPYICSIAVRSRFNSLTGIRIELPKSPNEDYALFEFSGYLTSLCDAEWSEFIGNYGANYEFDPKRSVPLYLGDYNEYIKPVQLKTRQIMGSDSWAVSVTSFTGGVYVILVNNKTEANSLMRLLSN